MNGNQKNIPEYISVSAMAKLMEISRSRLYQLIDQGVVLRPVYLLSNRRPIYTKEMALHNLEVKQKNVGIGGQVVMFYSSRSTVASAKKSPKQPVDKAVPNTKHSDLIEALESLGLADINSNKIDSAIAHCFPDGTENTSEDDIIREVFRYLKRQNSEHKPRT